MMTHKPFQQMSRARSVWAMGTLALGLSLGVLSSCTQLPSPKLAARNLNASSCVVYSYNDQSATSNRICEEMGPMPERAQRALGLWLKKSVKKEFSYIYPQYFIAVSGYNAKVAEVWALCTDGRGNLVGVLIPKKGVPAWDMPSFGNYELYVCQGSARDGLSSSILTTLYDAGYDKMRLDARRASGLVEARYLRSKPSDTVAPTPVAAEKPAAEPAAASDEEAASDDEAVSDDDSSMSDDELPMDDESMEESSDDESSDSLEDEPASDDESSDDLGDDLGGDDLGGDDSLDEFGL